MQQVESTDRVNDFGLVGTLGRPHEFGQRIHGGYNYGEEEYQIPFNSFGYKTYGYTKYGADDIRAGVYQRQHHNGKIIYRRLKFYTPKNPRTAPQQSWRASFTAGMTAWGNLTDEQKAVYNERVKGKPLHGVNLFLREYLKSL